MKVIFVLNVVILLLYESAKHKSDNTPRSSFHITLFYMLDIISYLGCKENVLNKLNKSKFVSLYRKFFYTLI
jgi:hypothetical protein